MHHLAKPVFIRFWGLLGGYIKYAKNLIHLPRQCLMDVAKSLILLGFLDEDVDFTPYLHLWKIGSVDKMYGMTRDMFWKLGIDEW